MMKPFHKGRECAPRRPNDLLSEPCHDAVDKRHEEGAQIDAVSCATKFGRILDIKPACGRKIAIGKYAGCIWRIKRFKKRAERRLLDIGGHVDYGAISVATVVQAIGDRGRNHLEVGEGIGGYGDDLGKIAEE